MGNHQFAIEDFNQAIHIASEDIEGYYSRGISHLKSKSFKDAEDDFEKAMKIEGSENFPGILDGLGSCHLAL